MANIVLKNTDGNVLRQSDGLLLKANFDYGFGVTNAGARWSRAIDSPLSVVLWRHPNSGGFSQFDAMMELVNAAGDTIGAHVRMDLIRIYVEQMKAGVISTFASINNSHTYNLTAFTVDTQAMRVKVYTEDAVLRASGIYDVANGIRQMNLFRHNRNGRGLASSVGLYAQAWVFERILSPDEISYLYNKGLANDPLTDNGLIADFRFDKAEQLTVPNDVNGGTKTAAAFRNFVEGGVHAEMIGLPAGTVAEQVAYANANYIKVY